MSHNTKERLVRSIMQNSASFYSLNVTCDLNFVENATKENSEDKEWGTLADPIAAYGRDFDKVVVQALRGLGVGRKLCHACVWSAHPLSLSVCTTEACSGAGGVYGWGVERGGGRRSNQESAGGVWWVVMRCGGGNQRITS